MPSIGMPSPSTPGDNGRTASPRRVDVDPPGHRSRPVRKRVSVHDMQGATTSEVDSVTARPGRATHDSGRHRRRNRSWQCLLGDVLQDWGITARAGVLMAIVFVGLTGMIVAAFGATGIVMLVALLVALKRMHGGGSGEAPAV